MSAPDTTVFQFNFKDVTGNLHNIYATTAPEAVELLDAFQTQILSKVFEVQDKIAAVNTVATTRPAPASTPAPFTPTTSAAPATPPAGEAPLCEHGLQAKLVPAGIGKTTGRPYRAFWACPEPRATQCNFKASV